MATRRTHRHSHETPEHEEQTQTRGTLQEESSLSAEGEANGAAGTSEEVRVSPTGSNKAPAMERAEALADRLGERISHYASVFGFKILQFAARAKEEAEDIWAEAQNIRRGNPPPQD
jgi:hypothetical protein